MTPPVGQGKGTGVHNRGRILRRIATCWQFIKRSGERGITARELCELGGWQLRTVYRDLDTMLGAEWIEWISMKGQKRFGPMPPGCSRYRAKPGLFS